MDVTLHWDDDEETIVRWEFTGFMGRVDYIIPVNETAGMGIMAGGRADVIVNMGWKLAFPLRPMPEMKKPILATRSYGLGCVVMVVKNPLARWLIQSRLLDDEEMRQVCAITPSLAAARVKIEQMRASAPPAGMAFTK